MTTEQAAALLEHLKAIRLLVGIGVIMLVVIFAAHLIDRLK
jgi:hypothetical protein